MPSVALTRKCTIIYWSLGSLSGAESLNRTDSPSSSLHKVPEALQTEVGIQSPHQTHNEIFTGLILFKSCTCNHSVYERTAF